MSAKTGLNLNTVSMTQTRKNNTGGESKINDVPSVSVKADSNLNTVSMTPTLKLKNTKEVPLQLLAPINKSTINQVEEKMSW